MAVREIQGTYNGNYTCAANPVYDVLPTGTTTVVAGTSITVIPAGSTITSGGSATLHAGAPVARSLVASNIGNVVPADRAIHGLGAYIGVLADDASRTGNTMIEVDPVGSTYLDSTNTFQANNNGFFVAQKRAIGDFQFEPVNNVTNLTAGASGYQGPARGVGVYVSPLAHILITDQFALYKTNDSGSATGETLDSGVMAGGVVSGGSTYTNSGVTIADAVFTSTDTYNVNDLVTFGAGGFAGSTGNAGLFVKVNPAANFGKICGRVDSYSASAGTLQITTF